MWIKWKVHTMYFNTFKCKRTGPNAMWLILWERLRAFWLYFERRGRRLLCPDDPKIQCCQSQRPQSKQILIPTPSPSTHPPTKPPKGPNQIMQEVNPTSYTEKPEHAGMAFKQFWQKYFSWCFTSLQNTKYHEIPYQNSVCGSKMLTNTHPQSPRM